MPLHHVIWTALSMASSCSLSQDNKHEVQHNYYGYITPVEPALASYDAESVVTNSIVFLWSRQLT